MCTCVSKLQELKNAFAYQLSELSINLLSSALLKIHLISSLMHTVKLYALTKEKRDIVHPDSFLPYNLVVIMRLYNYGSRSTHRSLGDSEQCGLHPRRESEHFSNSQYPLQVCLVFFFLIQ